LKYELDKLDQFIAANLSIESLFGWCNDEADLLANLLFIKVEKERIRQVLMMEVGSIEDDRTAQKYIRMHQSGLVYLANKVIDYKEVAIPKVGGFMLGHYLKFCDEVQNSLEFLLGFIEKLFSQYFDRDAAISQNHLRLIENELTETLVKFKELPYREIDKPLCDLVGSILLNRLSERLTPITYRTAFYIRELISLVMSAPENLQKELGYLNFNDPVFYKYCTNKMALELLEKGGAQERIHYMQFCMKELKQLQTRPNFIYRLDCMNIQQWLAEWLCEEIAYQEKTQQPIITMPPAGSAISTESEKYELNLSVGQLGLLASLFIEQCMPNHPAHKKMAMIIAKNFITKRAGKKEDISWESLLGKFYKHDWASRDIVVELLLRMVKSVKELKG
jgi:hypothetical protein